MRLYLRRVRSRLVLVFVATLGASLLAASPVGAGGQAAYGCAPGFDLGGLTFAQSLDLPRTQAGLAAGVFDTSGLASAFDRFDRNGDGVICFQDVGALNGDAGFWQYFYNVVDNNASVPDR